MLSSELRTKYLKFFEERGHLIMPSDSLVPNDPTLLFTSAGMVQFKPYFVGEQAPPSPRAVTSQKCLRTDDIEEVGDAVHHTFFEMLGNFSFGDYFKRESIIWAWEFLTDVLKLNPDHLWTSVYLDDDEAYDIWIKEIGFPEKKIVRLGEDKNYWPANAPTKGPNGPCGPCNEIFLDVTPEKGFPEDPTWSIAHDGNRFVEIWNLVFQQFDRREGGEMKPLPTKNIDTGMGLERTIAVLNGTPTDYETDLFLPIINHIENITGVKYGSDEISDRAMRVIADHTRGFVFAAADGVMPSNAGRGYVIRRMIRKSVLRSRALGVERNFLPELVPIVVSIMRDVYPEISQRESFITAAVKSEEERFRRTLDAGVARLEELLNSAQAIKDKRISGEAAFTLYDTFGFPIELTAEIAKERGIEIDMAGFEAAMEEQRKKARESMAIPAELFGGGGGALLEIQKAVHSTQFIGYKETSATCQIAAILKDGKLVEKVSAGEKAEIVLDQTPFYAESGGQVGDIGEITHNGSKLTVDNTVKAADIFFHHCNVVQGDFSVGMRVHAEVDRKRRLDIARNHTATHLLHAALRRILGEHALQAGSVVEPNRFRFDFSHPSSLSPEEIRAIENLVNEKVLEDLPVEVSEISLEEARNLGATALFGEKYGDVVRVVKIDDYSIELCGGTHLDRTSQVGFFKLTSEGSIGANLRRLEGVTGRGALALINRLEDTLLNVSQALNAPPSELDQAATRLISSLKEAQKELEKYQAKGAAEMAVGLAEKAKSVSGVNLVVSTAKDAGIESLRTLADGIADKLASAVVVLGGVTDGKVTFVCKVTSDLVAKGLHAGNLVREIAKAAGGGGGGKPEFAQAGGKDPSKLEDALALAEELVSAAIKK